MHVESHKETIGFQAEVKQLLDLVIHSLYSNKEIFLRELISNASDANEKLRFLALSDDALYEGDSELKIWVKADPEKRAISVRDNGVGMSREEVVSNLGTIAKSGTKEFFRALTGDQAKDSQLIGQFGVGFYSVFIVADRVTVLTRKAGLSAEHGVRWESGGEGDFIIENIELPQRGTEIILHFRSEEDEFLQDYRLRGIIKKYSDHIMFPILMPQFLSEEEQKEGKKAEEESVNSTTALWARPKQDIKDEEYAEFYKHIAHDFELPLLHIHHKVEGKLEYISLLFVPSRAPFDLWDRNNRHGVKLYVRRVFIMDDAEQLLPTYLRFIRGVIDSNDLPLNISREILQNNKQIDNIRSGVVKRILGALENLAENEPEKYTKVWKEFGRVLKEGILDDHANRDKVAKLLRFSSTFDDNPDPAVSLADYLKRMREGQEKIYYITAESFNAAKNSPHLEVFRKKGIEILLLHEHIDEWVVMHLHEFEGKLLQSVTKGGLELGKLEEETEKKQVEQANEEFKPFIERVKTALGEKVQAVRMSNRLTTSPACLVASEDALDARLERLLKAAGQFVQGSKPILEVNPQHPLIQSVREETDEDRFKDWALLLFDQALLSEGGQLDDAAAFVQRLNQMFIQIQKTAG